MIWNVDSNYIFRWYIRVLLALVLAGIVGAYFVNLNDIVRGRLLVFSSDGRAEVTARSEGYVNEYIKIGDLVKNGDFLGVVDSKISRAALLWAEHWISNLGDRLSEAIAVHGAEDEVRRYLPKISGAMEKYRHATLELDLHERGDEYMARQSYLGIRRLGLERQRQRTREQLEMERDNLSNVAALWEQVERQLASTHLSQIETIRLRESVLNAFAHVHQSEGTLERIEDEINAAELEQTANKSAWIARGQNLKTASEIALLELAEEWRAWTNLYALRSETSGLVVESRVGASGSRVSAGETVFVVVGGDQVDIVGFVPTSGAAYIEADQRVRLYFSELKGRGARYLRGRVLQVARHPVDGEYRVTLDLDAGHEMVRAGMSGTAEIYILGASVWCRIIGGLCNEDLRGG